MDCELRELLRLGIQTADAAVAAGIACMALISELTWTKAVSQ
jgi:hypothetical protein